MWITLILLLAIAMIVGPVVMLRPPPGTQRLADLRRRAAELGLSVQLGHVPGEKTGEAVAIYLRPWPSLKNRNNNPSWLLVKRNFAHEIHCADHWDWQGDGRPAEHVIEQTKTLLADLPDSVVAIEANAAGVSCYWQELGGQKTLQQIANWLDDLVTAAVLPALPSKSL